MGSMGYPPWFENGEHTRHPPPRPFPSGYQQQYAHPSAPRSEANSPSGRHLGFRVNPPPPHARSHIGGSKQTRTRYSPCESFRPAVPSPPRKRQPHPSDRDQPHSLTSIRASHIPTKPSIHCESSPHDLHKIARLENPNLQHLPPLSHAHSPSTSPHFRLCSLRTGNPA